MREEVAPNAKAGDLLVVQAPGMPRSDAEAGVLPCGERSSDTETDDLLRARRCLGLLPVPDAEAGDLLGFRGCLRLALSDAEAGSLLFA